MTQEKMRKVIAACVSAATVLLVTLLSVLVYGWVTIAVLDDRIVSAEAEVKYWTELRDNALDKEEYVKSDFYLRQAALELHLLLQEKNK